MNIFMTGQSALQINWSNPRTRKINVPAIMVERLTEMGHGVTWGNGFDFPDDTDLLLFNIATVCSHNGGWGLSGLWAFKQALKRGIPVVIHFDDWQVKTVLSHHRTFHKKGSDQVFKTMGDQTMYARQDIEVLGRHPDRVDDIIEAAGLIGHALGNQSGVRYLFPMYAFGDRQLVLDTCFAKNGASRPIEDAFLYDPSPFIELAPAREQTSMFDEPWDGAKAREWILAALMPHKDWADKLELTWDVAYFGAKKLGAPRLPTEGHIIAETMKRWGVLSPPYHQSGSGWFRSRYLYAAMYGSILLADERDCAPLGEAYLRVARDPNMVVSLSDDELKTLAAEQSGAFLPKIAQTATHSDALLDAAITF